MHRRIWAYSLEKQFQARSNILDKRTGKVVAKGRRQVHEKLHMDLRSQSKYWTGGFRSLGYECNHQKNLKTLRGAKSNGLFLGGTKWNRNCPCDGLGAMRS